MGGVATVWVAPVGLYSSEFGAHSDRHTLSSLTVLTPCREDHWYTMPPRGAAKPGQEAAVHSSTGQGNRLQPDGASRKELGYSPGKQHSRGPSTSECGSTIVQPEVSPLI